MKLGEIRYNRASPIRSADPSTAAQSYQNERQTIMDVTGGIAKVSNELGKKQAESQVNLVNAKTRQEVDTYITKYGDGQPRTLSQLKELGIDMEQLKQHPDWNQVKRDENNTPGSEVVPAHMWFSQGLEAQMNRSREVNAGDISNYAVRQEWNAQTSEAQQKAITASYLQSAKMQVEWNFNRVEAERNAAIEREDWTTALELIDNDVYSNLSGAEKDLMLQETLTKKEISQWELRLMSPDVEDVEDMLLELSGEDYDGILDLPTRRKMAFSAVTRIDKLERDREEAEEERHQRNQAELEMSWMSGTSNESDFKLAYDKGEISYQGFRLLTALARSASTTTSFDAPDADIWQAQQQQKISALKLGLRSYLVEDGQELPDFEEQIAEVEKDIVAGMVWEDENGNFYRRGSTAEMRALLDDLKKVEEVARNTYLYEDLVNDMSLRIEGVRFDERAQRMSQDPDAAKRMADALNSLNSAVEGVAPEDLPAVITAWKQDQYLQFMNSALRAEALGINDPAMASMFNAALVTDSNGLKTWDKQVIRQQSLDRFNMVVRNNNLVPGDEQYIAEQDAHEARLAAMESASKRHANKFSDSATTNTGTTP